MFTAIALVCLFGSETDCQISTSPMFFPTIELCEATNEQLTKMINTEDGHPTHYIKETSCVGWGDKV